MAGAVHSVNGVYSVTKGGALSGRNMTVTCPTAAPAGSVLALCIAVHGRNDETTQHEYSNQQTGWTRQTFVDNYVSTDYWQLWLFTRTKAAGDSSWTFESQVQANPCRTWIMVALTGVVETPGSTASAFSLTNVTNHTFTGLTMNAIGDVFLGFTIVLRSEMSAEPTLTYIGGNTKGGDSPRVYPSKISAWHKVVAASGATGAFNYTSADARDYASLSIEFNGVSGSQTIGAADSPTMGEITVPAYAGFPKLSAASSTAATTFDTTLRDEQGVPILLATLSPLESDAPNAATSTEKFSSGWYDRTYQSAIRTWPEITRSLYGGSVVGGRVGFTIGELALLNDRESAPGDEYGKTMYVGSVLKATARGVFKWGLSGTSDANLTAESAGGVPAQLTATCAIAATSDTSGFVVRHTTASRFYLTNYEPYTVWADPNATTPYNEIFDNSEMHGPWPFTDKSASDLRHRAGFIAPDGPSTETTSVTANNNEGSRILHYVSAPMTAQTISGTVKSWLQWEESNLDDNLDQVYAAIHVISRDCTTLKATLLAGAQYDGGNLELHNSIRSRVSIASATAISSYDCADGDRLQVEYAVGHSGAGTSRRAYVTIGANSSSSTDVPENNTDTSTYGLRRPWIEFSDTIKLEDNYLWPPVLSNGSYADTFTSDVTQHTIDLASFAGGYKSGDRIIVFFANDGNATVSVGAGSATKFVDELANGSTARMTGWYINCTSGSHTLRLDTSAAEKAAYVAFVQPAGTFHVANVPEEGAVTTGNSTTPTPAAFTPSWGGSGYHQQTIVQVDWWSGGISAYNASFVPDVKREVLGTGGVGISVGGAIFTGAVADASYEGSGVTLYSASDWGSIGIAFCPVN